MNDNRNYKFKTNAVSDRYEYPIILSWVKKNSTVIDLGCGDGSLLKLLEEKKKTKGEGIEISSSGVRVCKTKGLNVHKGRIDKKLPYKDKQFDYAICNVTLQMVMYPEILLSEMKRISKYQIISFPNFAFILNRLDLLINGKMPRFCLFGHQWYSTGHIHQLSIRDFNDFCKNNKIKIIKSHHLLPVKFLKNIFPNLFSITSIFLTK